MSGVCGHSSPVKPGCYVIFSASGYNRQYVHEFFTQSGIAYKDLDGCWEGQPEEAYIVHADDYDNLGPVIWNERAVLWLGEIEQYGVRDAWVRYREGTPDKYLGKFTRVTGQRARQDDAWTYDPDEGAHYICFNDEALSLRAPWDHTVPAVAYAA